MNGPCFGLGPDEPEDQVPRLEKFRAAHPEIDVTAPGGTPDRYSQWIARRDGKVLASDFELRWLLDALEELVEE